MSGEKIGDLKIVRPSWKDSCAKQEATEMMFRVSGLTAGEKGDPHTWAFSTYEEAEHFCLSIIPKTRGEYVIHKIIAVIRPETPPMPRVEIVTAEEAKP
jgi:hypothetical protein